MVKEAIATGDSVEQAFEQACKMLGVESHEAEFEILELPGKKKFGLFGGAPAKVRAFTKTGPAQAAAEYLQKVLEGMGIPSVQIETVEQEGGALLSLTGDDIGFIIGHRGETLDALQYLSGLVANHVEDSYYRITLDIGNYREKRKETLEALGKKMAAKALKTQRNCSLEPMNPYERRIIHTAVQEVEGVKSWSEGEDLGRHVVIGPEGGEKPMFRRQGNRSRSGDFHKDRGGRPPQGNKYAGGNRSSKNGGHSDYRGSSSRESRPPQKTPAGSLYGKVDVAKKAD
ncbi:RNA-binding cell elongation regulator Jag/EloR [Clostridium minihomine]|uniref:RNA-binding cell elongation regulator Jag/EloR n=1 Tax=Clostridium minihomine TaxID=2045012 RepID=UPI000C75ED89|nr:RNA-binding cell elongation regulator Jag/EloR [Clostridium minihomine]